MVTGKSKRGKDGLWYPSVVSAGNREILFAGEGHKNKKDSDHALELLGVAVGAKAHPDPEPPRALLREAGGPQGVLAGRQWLPREVADLCEQAGWSELDKLVEMVATVFAESAGYEQAKGPQNADGTYDYGLFQLNDGHAAAWGMTPEAFVEMAYLPERAVMYARKLYVAANYNISGPWVAHATGAYKKFLPKSILGVANMYAKRQGWSPTPYFKAY